MTCSAPGQVGREGQIREGFWEEVTSELRRISQDNQKGGEGAKDQKYQIRSSGRWGNREKHNLELLVFKCMELGDHACNLEKKGVRDFPGILSAKTLPFQCRGPGYNPQSRGLSFDPWPGN